MLKFIHLYCINRITPGHLIKKIHKKYFTRNFITKTNKKN